MKINYIISVVLLSIICSCSKEESLVATKELKIYEKVSPKEDEAPEVHKLFNDYGVWIRMDFDKYKEVSFSPLGSDPNCRGVIKILDEDRASAIAYSESLMSNVSKEFAKRYFPWELFFVNTYGESWWIYQFQQISRNRLVITWPNKTENTIPITDMENHYYQDSVLTSKIWNYLGTMIAFHIDTPIEEFVLGGKAYDNGEAVDKINKQYTIDGDKEKRDAAYAELTRIGGYITSGSSRNFQADFASWLQLMVLESYENIKFNYLDDSEPRRIKYNVLVQYFKDLGWDIQASGNKYRMKYDEYKASLPAPEPEE